MLYPTSLDRFVDLYESRIHSNRPSHVTRADLRNHPTVHALQHFPQDILVATAPERLSRCLTPLTEQLQQWVRELKATHADTYLPSASTLHRRRVYGRCYFTDGPSAMGSWR